MYVKTMSSIEFLPVRRTIYHTCTVNGLSQVDDDGCNAM